ncbi:Redox-sensitive transcriptional activator SoxR [[Actinomadura] parvosata subsp. kistnae]|uniref:Transcriptional regulator n=1 Tax=[Actinomadura] parvosata subsp. kistnae TaxID=1909395 RepID=A0A1V0AEK7_9ACTN|nr:MerR family transcriptional regulator [Nonomuraea sp. ATCC 55076]AQZ68647.1 transcriptional regulator [Nonomuraea sp. ATCC 55076]SPL92872.1 Redox-sensitive transcriptional activator SoxR [Actinomadura parvosata subsp. kistnae]
MTVTGHHGPEAGSASLTVGQVAVAAGVTANAVRFYERYGVITAHRNSGNARRFTVDAICRIRLALAAQRVGLTLKESADILAGIPPLSRDLAQWLAAGEELVRAGRARVDQLQATVNELATMDFLQDTRPHR